MEKLDFPQQLKREAFSKSDSCLLSSMPKEYFNDIKHKQVLLQVSDGVQKSMEALFKSPRCVYFTPICTHTLWEIINCCAKIWG